MPSQLYVHKRPIEFIFELFGSDENDIPYSVGWALHSSPAFLRRFLKETIHYGGNLDGVTIRLQDYRKTQGITDIEINKPREFHIIVEAKKGWNLPGLKQLKKYATRLSNNQNRTRRIFVVSECSAKYAEENLESTKVRGVSVQAMSWKDIARMAEHAVSEGKHREKRLLRDMLSYLGRVTTMKSNAPNKVYVVSLNPIGIRNVGRRLYSHPVGPLGGWPKEPPDYIAFRYHGKLQSIHHVDGHEERKVDPLEERASRERTPHFLYRLGPAIVPPKEVRTGAIFRNGRVWCFWDTLFTCRTISQARDVSKKRSKMTERMGG